MGSGQRPPLCGGGGGGSHSPFLQTHQSRPGPLRGGARAVPGLEALPGREAPCSEPNKAPVTTAAAGNLKPRGRFGEQAPGLAGPSVLLPFLPLGVPAPRWQGPTEGGGKLPCVRLHSPVTWVPPSPLTSRLPRGVGRAVALTFLLQTRTLRLRYSAGAPSLGRHKVGNPGQTSGKPGSRRVGSERAGSSHPALSKQGPRLGLPSAERTTPRSPQRKQRGLHAGQELGSELPGNPGKKGN